MVFFICILIICYIYFMVSCWVRVCIVNVSIYLWWFDIFYVYMFYSKWLIVVKLLGMVEIMNRIKGKVGILEEG